MTWKAAPARKAFEQEEKEEKILFNIQNNSSKFVFCET